MGDRVRATERGRPSVGDRAQASERRTREVLQTRRSGPAPPPRDGAAGRCCGPSVGAARPDFRTGREEVTGS